MANSIFQLPPEPDFTGRDKDTLRLDFLDRFVRHMPATGRYLINADAIPDLTDDERAEFNALNRHYEIQDLMISEGYVEYAKEYSKPVTSIGRAAKAAGGHYAYRQQVEEWSRPAPANVINVHGPNSGVVQQGSGNSASQDLFRPKANPDTNPQTNQIADRIINPGIVLPWQIRNKELVMVIIGVVLSAIITAILHHYGLV